MTNEQLGKIQDLSNEIWRIAHNVEMELGTPTRGEFTGAIASALHGIKNAIYQIDELTSILKYLDKPF